MFLSPTSLRITHLGGEPQFDRSHFKLQTDGTFKISIRGVAAMAGVDFGSFARNLRSAVAENVLPCAKSPVAQGFNPAHVSPAADRSQGDHLLDPGRRSGAQDGSQHLSFIHLEVVPKAAEAFVAGDLLNGGQIDAAPEGTCGE